MEISEEAYSKITEYCRQGDMLLEDGNTELAYENYISALDLIPNPKINYEAATWIYVALGDIYLSLKDYEKARDSYYDAMNCPNGMTNPYVLLRLGETLVETKDDENAKEYLLRAYMLVGDDIFLEEDEKYYSSIKDIIKTSGE